MIAANHNKISFCDIVAFPYFKTTLPAKIIQLRKVSQENHVRRMKIAHQRKQMQPPSDASMNLASGAPRRNSSSLEAPFTMTGNRFHSSDTEYSYSFERNRCRPSTANRNHFSPKILDTSNRKRDCHSRFTDLKKAENPEFINRNVKSDSIIDYSENVNGKYSSDFKCKTPNFFARNNKYQTETGLSKSSKDNEKTHKPSQLFTPKVIDNKTISSKNRLNNTSNIFQQSNVKELKDSKNVDITNFNGKGDKIDFREYGDINTTLTGTNSSDKKTKNASKIPIPLTRLPCKDKNTTNQLRLSYNCHKSSQQNKASNSKLQIEVVIRNAKEAGENDMSEKRKKFLNEENENTPLRNSLTGCFSRDLKNTPSNKAHEHTCGRDVLNREGQLFSNRMSSVSCWLNNIEYRADSNKKTNVSHLESHENTNAVKDKRKVLRTNLISKSLEKPCATALKSSNEQTESVSDSSSDKSLEYFYDTETGNDTVTQDEDKNGWREDSDDEGSMVTVPTSKSTCSDAPKKFTSQEVLHEPDYPKTPYDLRYPRYKAKEFDSTKKYGENHSARAKTPKSKNRKKSSKSTPKRKKCNKSKRNLNFKKQEGQS